MDFFTKMVDFAIESARKEEQKHKPLSGFRVVREARFLVGPAKKNAAHHREREKHYCGELEKAEVKLRTDGVTVKVWDPSKGYNLQTPSGGIGSGAIGNTGAQFQAQMDQGMMDAVRNAKDKMIEHRQEAEKFEKYARAFACAPTTTIELTVEDVHLFKLES